MSEIDNNLLEHQDTQADSGKINPVEYVPKGTKKPLSKERLEQLAKARQKAIISRKANAEVKRKERELEKMRKQQAKQKVCDDYASALAPKEIRQEYRRKPKSKPKKKRIVYVSDSEEEEVEQEIAPPFKQTRRVMPMGQTQSLTRTKSLYNDVGW